MTDVTMVEFDIDTVNRELQDKSAFDMLKWCYDHFDKNRIKLSTSFGAEGMVLVHMLANTVDNPKIFTIDTGRNFQETYDVWDEVVKRYNVEIESWHPDPEDISELTKRAGPNLFYAGIAERKQCCFVRKVKPLKKALKETDLWIAGLRREQGPSRKNTPLFAYVPEHNVYKICPLVNWQEETVWDYIRNNDVPYHKLYDAGYPTIGCAPCSRPVGRAQDTRSGRWWWENQEHKECGLHIENGKIVRKKGAINFTI